MDWVEKGLYWVAQGTDWVAHGVTEITDPRWLRQNTGWASLLGVGMVLMVGWFCLFRGGKGR